MADLFAGIGGLRRGSGTRSGRCVFACGCDRHAQRICRANFGDGPDCPVAGDIREVRAEDVPEHDLLLAGFPCQPFPIAGVSKKNKLGQPHGFRWGSQGTLFSDVARIVAPPPKAFVPKNAKTCSTTTGRAFRVIRGTLEDDLATASRPA